MGDLRDFKAVRAAAEGMDAVFHAASFGMSGKDQLDKARIMAINVGGTEHVIKACQEGNVFALVYTSTTNVVFAGNELHNQDESLPYLPLDRHVDYYSRSKCIAEQLVLQANDSSSSSPSSSLKTCAIRPAGIYGEGEERHLPRIVDMMDKGLFCFTIGRADSKVEFVYVDNLVHAHILAAVKLLKRNKRKEEKEGEEKDIGGRAYFISDWEPINNFEFFRPLLEGLGFRYPSLNLPTWLMYYVALFIETIHWLVGRFYNFQPLLTRAEVYKVSVTHYFKPDRARAELGYRPFITTEEGMKRVVSHYRALRSQKQQSKSSSTFSFFLFVLASLGVAALSCWFAC